jgi:RNA polymerase sigma-70 factor (ECF subfamily)
MLDEHWVAETNALLYRIQREDELALKILYDLSATRLSNQIFAILNDSHEVEDVLQDVFVSIWQQAKKYSEKGSAWGWICVLARHRAIDRLRRLSIRQQESTDASPELLNKLSEEVNNIDKHWIGQCLSQLPPKTQQAILLSYINGYSHSELSQLLSTPLGTVKAWIRRGLQELKLCLNT